jgi:hypothetical protein
MFNVLYFFVLQSLVESERTNVRTLPQSSRTGQAVVSEDCESQEETYSFDRFVLFSHFHVATTSIK